MDKPIIFRSKNEQVYDLLKQKIVRGELKPDQSLVIDLLAKELGISAIPIREALRQLEANGFVHIEPYVGAKVTSIHAGSIIEIFSMLRSMEVITGRAACETMTDADIEALGDIVREMAEQIDKPDTWSTYNKQFHQFICNKAGMYMIEKMLMVALDHWDRVRCYYLEEVFAQRIQFRQMEHEQILDALRKRDPNLLEKVMHDHNQESLKAYMTHLQQKNVITPP